MEVWEEKAPAGFGTFSEASVSKKTRKTTVEKRT
jgi:hypothetical protein